jgi:carbon-monoxide dehydrogenase large subunit
MAMPARPAIAADRVRHVGDTVAMVVAETAAAARDAVERLAVDYEPLPSVVDTGRALDPGQPVVWPEHRLVGHPGNLCFDWEIGDAAAVERAAAAARHRVSLSLVNNRIIVNSMEPRGAIGEYDPGEDSYTLWSSTQGSHFVRNLLAEHIFHVPENRIRVVTPDVGGGFGMKLFLYPEHVLVLWAAKRLERPVKWIPDRSDSFMTDTQGRDNLTRLDLALDEELRFIGLKVEITANMGAYLSNFAPEIPTFSGAVMYSGVYALPAIHVRVLGVFTNTVPVDAYRGAGRPEAAYAVERLVDHAARQLGVAAAELRGCNFIKPATMPHTTALGLAFDSGDFARNMADALAAADAAGFDARRAAARALPRAGVRGLYRAMRRSARRIRRVALRSFRHANDPDGHAILGAGAPDRLRPARHRNARPRPRQDPGAAGRYRCGRLWPRHRRVAFAPGRRRRACPCRRQADRQGEEDRRASPRSIRGRHRLCGRRIHDSRHRPHPLDR